MARNIDLFNAFAIKLLDDLYDEFPVPITIRTRDFIESPDLEAWLRRIDEEAAAIGASPGENPFARAEAVAKKSGEMSKETQDSDERRKVFVGTMDFLVGEGFLRHSAEYSEKDVYYGCQLTAKGLLQLNKSFTDKQIDPGESIISRIKHSNPLKFAAGVAQNFLGSIIAQILSPSLQ